MIYNKTKRVLAFVVMFAIAMSMVTVTMPVYAAETTLWSQDFEDLTANPWVDATLWGGTDCDTYKNANSVSVTDGKLTVTKNQLAGTSIDTDYVRMAVPLSSSGTFTTPDSGYLTFDFDYTQNINWVDENPYSNLLLINAASNGANIAGFGFGDETRGLRVISGNEDQWAAANENVAPASAYVGQNVSVRLLFDLENDQYSVYYAPAGGEKVKAYGPVAIPSVAASTLASGGFDLNNLRFTIACTNTTAVDGDSVVMAFDNFAIKTYTENPEEEVIIPNIVATNQPDGSTGIGLTEPQKIEFDTPMSFKSLSNVRMYQDSINGKNIPLTPSLSTDGLGACFAHEPLKYSTDYVMVIPTTVKSSTNGALAEEEIITFTTIDAVDPHKDVVWFENFDHRTDWDVMESRAGWGTLIYENGTPHSTMGDNDNTKKQKIEFRNGGVYITKPQDFTGAVGNTYARLTVAFMGYTTPKTGYVAVEFDYNQAIEYKSKYPADVRIQNSAGKDLTLLAFNSSYYGFQDSTVIGRKCSEHGITDTNGNGTIDAHEIPQNNIGVPSTYVGKDMRVQVLYDLDNSKYIINYFVDGVRYVAKEGWQNMLPDRDYNLSQISVSASCNPSSGAKTNYLKYDNISIIEYSAPEVETISTPNGATDIAIDEPVTMTFTEPMLESTVEDITLTQGGSPVSISSRELSADGKTLTLSHGNLTNNTTYTLTIPTTVTSQDYFGLKNDAVYTFTTVPADAAPVVKSTSHTNGSEDVSRTDDIVLTFSKPMDVASLSGVTLVGEQNVPLTIEMSNSNKTATFKHQQLEYGTEYTLTVPTTVKAADNTLIAQNISYTFTTIYAPTKPVITSSSVTDTETGVSVTSGFVITFDKAMDVSTFDNIRLMKGDTPVTLSTTVTNGNKTITLGHPKLENNTQYTLIIPTTVKSSIGLALASEARYTFTTAPAVQGETLLYGYYFDGAPDGSTEPQASYTGNNWEVYTRWDGTKAYKDNNNIQFKDGKMVITKVQDFTGAFANFNAYAKVDLSSVNIPTTGIVAIEYDIKHSSRPGFTWTADTHIANAKNESLSRLCFGSGSYGWKDMLLTNNVNTATTITSNIWLEKQDIHVKFVYNYDDWTYTMFYTVNGVTYQSPVGVAALPATTSKKITSFRWDFSNQASVADPLTITIDNFEVKTLEKPQLTENTSVTNGQTGVSATDRIKIAFNSPMNIEYFSDIKIYEGTVAAANLVSTTSVVGEDNTICYVYPDHGLKYKTKYVIDIPTKVVCENLIPVDATQIEFTTENTTVGYSAEFMSVKNLGGLDIYNIAGQNFVKATVRFTNNLGSLAQAPVLAVALCNKDGKVKSISYCDRLVLLGKTQDVTVSFTSGTPFENGDYLKAYVMDRNTGDYMSSQVSY